METFSRRLAWAMLFSSIASTACATSAQQSSDPAGQLESRYQLDRASITRNEQQLPSGHFNLRGELTEAVPVEVRSLTAGGVAPTPEALARAFAANNLSLFDIADPVRDLNLVSSRQDHLGNHHLRFHRIINGLRLEGMEVLFHVNAQGEVYGANGNIVRVATELHEFLQKNPRIPRQKEEKILDVIGADLGLPIAEFQIKDLQLLAANEAPFVVWQLEVQPKRRIGHFSYRISDDNASILQKQDLMMKHMRRN